MGNSGQSHDWKKAWNARKGAIELVLGKSEGTVLHAIKPFFLGGAADVIYCRAPDGGRFGVTCELLGESGQTLNSLGNYELLIAHRDNGDWGPKLISRLARYTCEKKLEPGHTMDIAGLPPKGSTITALLFDEYAKFTFEERSAGLLLCIGITASELRMCRDKKGHDILNALKAANIYPYTDLFRPAVILDR